MECQEPGSHSKDGYETHLPQNEDDHDNILKYSEHENPSEDKGDQSLPPNDDENSTLECPEIKVHDDKDHTTMNKGENLASEFQSPSEVCMEKDDEYSAIASADEEHGPPLKPNVSTCIHACTAVYI